MRTEEVVSSNYYEVARWKRNSGPFGGILGWIWGRCGVVLGGSGAPFGGSEANWGTCRCKTEAASISASPFGHEKWSPELLRSRPEDPKIDPRCREERSKRPHEHQTVKTSKTTTVSIKMHSFGGRDWADIWNA